MIKILTGNRSLISLYLDSGNYKTCDLNTYLDSKNSLFGSSDNYAVLCKKLPDLSRFQTDDFVVIPDKVDKRSKAYKAAIYLPFVKVVDYPSPSPWESDKLRDLVLEMASILGLKLTSEMARYVVSCAGNDLTEVAYILRTCLYANLAPTSVVDKASYFVLDVPKLYAEKDYKRLEEALDYLQTTTHPLPFLAAFKSVFKLYLYVVNGCSDDFFKQLKVHPYRVRILKQQCLKLQVETFHKTYSEVLNLERQLKRGLTVESFWRKLFLVLSNG